MVAADISQDPSFKTQRIQFSSFRITSQQLWDIFLFLTIRALCRLIWLGLGCVTLVTPAVMINSRVSPRLTLYYHLLMTRETRGKVGPETEAALGLLQPDNIWDEARDGEKWQWRGQWGNHGVTGQMIVKQHHQTSVTRSSGKQYLTPRVIGN